MERGPTLSLRARGPLACFTRPEFKVERMSYPVITPSAARGIIEAVMWKPAIRWRIERIRVLREIVFTSFKRNELNSKSPPPGKKIISGGGPVKHYFIEDDRAQRNTVALRDVDYVIEAHFEMTDRAGAGDNPYKFIDMFSRRVEKGQHYHQPYLGCREFAADILPADDAPDPVKDTRDLGIMLWDIDFAMKGKKPDNTPIFFNAKLEEGVLNVPLDPELKPVLMAEGGSK